MATRDTLHLVCDDLKLRAQTKSNVFEKGRTPPNWS